MGRVGSLYTCNIIIIIIIIIIRLYDSQDTLGKLMHFLPQLSDFVPLKNGFIFSSRRMPNISMFNLIATL